MKVIDISDVVARDASRLFVKSRDSFAIRPMTFTTVFQETAWLGLLVVSLCLIAGMSLVLDASRVKY